MKTITVRKGFEGLKFVVSTQKKEYDAVWGNRLDRKGFVNVYRVTRLWGGPEEGGWYYNSLRCIESFPCRYRNRHEIMNYMESEHAHEKYGDIYSVLGGADLHMAWELSPAESETRERPYYE